MSITTKRPRTLDYLPELPDSVIQKIHSFLPIDDVAKTTTLSKAWLISWSTYPALKFLQSRFHGDTAKFVKTVNDTLVRYRENNLVIESLEISLKKLAHIYDDNSNYIDVDVDSVVLLVSNWLKTAIRFCGLEKLSLEFSWNEEFELPLEIFMSKTLLEVCLTGSEVFMGPIWPVVESDHSLASLNLIDVSIKQDFLDQLLSCCPLIKNLSLRNCFGFDKVNLSVDNLKNLKEFQISGLYKYLVEISETVTFAYKSLVSIERGPSIFRFDDSRNLTGLELSEPGYGIDSKSLSKLLPQLPFLTSLILHRFTNFFHEIDITSDSLNSLTISSCPYLHAVNISSPRLESFTYSGTERVPSISFKKDVVGKLKSKLDLVCPLEIDISWLVMLQRWIFDLKQSDQVEILMRVRGDANICISFRRYIKKILGHDHDQLEIDLVEELFRLAPLHKVENVYIHIESGLNSEQLSKEMTKAVRMFCDCNPIIVSEGRSTK